MHCVEKKAPPTHWTHQLLFLYSFWSVLVHTSYITHYEVFHVINLSGNCSLMSGTGEIWSALRSGKALLLPVHLKMSKLSAFKGLSLGHQCACAKISSCWTLNWVRLFSQPLGNISLEADVELPGHIYCWAHTHAPPCQDTPHRHTYHAKLTPAGTSICWPSDSQVHTVFTALKSADICCNFAAFKSNFP